jgi:glycosyltransferase involved in cell wall biosynthesis
MNVLHVVASGQRRGAEIFARDLIGALSRNGFDQRVLVLRGSCRDVDFGVPEVRNGFSVDLRGRFRHWDVPTMWRPDVIQAHGGEALEGSLALAARSPACVVYRRIGLAPTRLSRFPRRQAFARLTRRADLVVAVSEAVRTEAERLFGLHVSKLITIPNGADAGRLRPSRFRVEERRLLGIAPDDPVVLSLGALSWEKDPITHVNVVTSVRRVHPSTVHVMVGDGPLRASVADAVGRSGSDARTQIMGTRSDVADLLRASDLLLFASRPDGMEGMPAAVIEAGMAALPVAGYAVAGVPEVVVQGETGLLCAPGNTADLGRHVRTLIADTALRAWMGERAQRRCKTLYDISVIADAYADAYERVVAPRRPSAETKGNGP